MIIQCEKCQTRFRLDDSRITDNGVKVRCTKCKHVFTVQKEVSEEESFEPMGGLTDSFSGGQGAASVASDSITETPFGSSPFPSTAVQTDSVDFSFDTSSFDTSDSSLESEITDSDKTSKMADEPTLRGGEVDFSGFDFGDGTSDTDSTPASALSASDFTETTTEPAAATPRKEASQGLDFSDDDMFGTVAPTAPEASSNTITFDFEGDSFADSMDISGQDSGAKSGPLFSLDTPGDTPFNLGEIDFGVELTSVAVQQVNPDDLKPSHEILFAPLAEAAEKTADDDLARSFLEEDSTGDQQELPPLPIASRRKQSPLFGLLIAVAAILVISVLGYFGYSSFSEQKESAPEGGKIGVRAVKAAFIENDLAGELLVITGEALNEYPKPRAALQVTVSVFDAEGQSVVTKSAYGGNPLTGEQLESMPLDKIEATMANQFGDSLANMEVAPGKAIPFVVVLGNLPKGATEFAVQSAGSTVATGKQQ